MVPVTEHNELPGLYETNGWSFSLAEEGDLEYIDTAIAAWQEWREFVVKSKASETQEPLL